MKMIRSEEGVSPVIGVILMVAITVILAAVIAVFVFGLAGDLESSSQKDITIKTGTTDQGLITWTIFAGKDVDAVAHYFITNGSAGADSYAAAAPVGTVNKSTYPRVDGLTITAVFKDGSSQVVASI